GRGCGSTPPVLVAGGWVWGLGGVAVVFRPRRGGFPPGWGRLARVRWCPICNPPRIGRNTTGTARCPNTLCSASCSVGLDRHHGRAGSVGAPRGPHRNLKGARGCPTTVGRAERGRKAH
ncbi:MAG: hypothetical protein AAFU79_34890, partial [Myxococcota bacterium]